MEPSQHITSHKLCILQINPNKSEKAHLELINARLSKKYNILLIQEPHTQSNSTTSELHQTLDQPSCKGNCRVELNQFLAGGPKRIR